MSRTKEVRDLVRRIEHQPDVTVESNGAGHFTVRKGGNFVTSLAKSPSDPRWRENAMADLRRAGITPANTPKVPTQIDLAPPSELLARIKRIENGSEFARWAATDLQAVYPHDKTERAIEVTISEFRNGRKQKLMPQYHELFDAAFKTWDRINGQQQQLVVESEPAESQPAIDPDTGLSISGWGIDYDRSHPPEEPEPIPEPQSIDVNPELEAAMREITEPWRKLIEGLEASIATHLGNINSRLDVSREMVESHDRQIKKLFAGLDEQRLQTPLREVRGDRRAYLGVLMNLVRSGRVSDDILRRIDKLVGLDA